MVSAPHSMLWDDWLTLGPVTSNGFSQSHGISGILSTSSSDT